MPRTFVPFPKNLVPVRIIRRLNRFVVEACPEQVPASGDTTAALRLHLPNSGRMRELLTPGARGLAAVKLEKERKTAGTLLVVRYNKRWVSVDARMPNRLFAKGVSSDAFSPFAGYRVSRQEAAWREGRIDFLLDSTSDLGPQFLVETKSCNLVEEGLALFPDAPTERGARHLKELSEAVQEGLRAAVVWFVQRDDAQQLAPHRDADPAFARALDEAKAFGVEAYAYRCRVDEAGVTVLDEIPVITN